MTMREKPRSKWSPTLESDLAAVRQELGTVPVEEMQAIERKREQEVAASQALHVCKCGGYLDDDKPLFCPSCQSLKLQYKVRYMT
jgi:rubrerythrin